MANNPLMSHGLLFVCFVFSLFLQLFSVVLDLLAGGGKIKSRESDRRTQPFKMLSNKLCQTYQSCEAPAATTQPTCIGLCSSSVIRCKKKSTETNMEMSLDGSTSVTLVIMILMPPITSSKMWRSHDFRRILALMHLHLLQE